MRIGALMAQLSSGMLTSVQIFVLTLLGSLPLGLLVTLGRMSKNGIVRNLSRVYISVLRGTPLMLQVMVVFFGPYYLFGISIGSSYRFKAVIIAFVLNYAAYFAEIYRAGIEAVAHGQYEAASVLGYSKSQTFMRIVLPQMVRHVLPPVTNEMITLIKDTSLAFAIAVTEMFTVAKEIASAQTSMVPYFAAAIFYYVFNLIVAAGMERVEKKLAYYH
ncbi:amino acid ABC transporter permease [Christensenellaceae bacterium OttesenSCG-928-L17]|nr:amino acid ABC transporter permease [Christensenellaceae bacterium OttesenSCG-928-L17]